MAVVYMYKKGLGTLFTFEPLYQDRLESKFSIEFIFSSFLILPHRLSHQM